MLTLNSSTTCQKFPSSLQRLMDLHIPLFRTCCWVVLSQKLVRLAPIIPGFALFNSRSVVVFVAHAADCSCFCLP